PSADRRVSLSRLARKARGRSPRSRLAPQLASVGRSCPSRQLALDTHAVPCMIMQSSEYSRINTMGAHKRFRQGQILKLLASQHVASQDELRRQLVHRGVRVTQATLSRDLRELRLVKTAEGYRSLTATPDDTTPSSLPLLARAVGEFLLDIRPAQNMLVLKTPPSGAQPLAAALDAQRWKEVAGTLAGDDTVLVICSSHKAGGAVR